MKAAAKAAWKPVGRTEAIRQQLASLDATTKTWADLIAPCMAQISRALQIDVDYVIDWIDDTPKPVNVFDFSSWARSR